MAAVVALSSTQTTNSIMMPTGILKNGASACISLGTQKFQFDEEAKVFHVLALAEYTVEEIRNCWYEDYEYSQIKANNKILAKMFSCNRVYPEDNTFCFRGLEFKLTENSKKRKMCKEAAVTAVISEQLKQWDEQWYEQTDVELIRKAYESITAEPQARAYQLGLEDASRIAQYDVDKEATSSHGRAGPRQKFVLNACADTCSVVTENDRQTYDGERPSSSGSKSISSTDAVAPSNPKGFRSLFKKATRRRIRIAK
jgi:hypothetical protein